MEISAVGKLVLSYENVGATSEQFPLNCVSYENVGATSERFPLHCVRNVQARV